MRFPCEVHTPMLDYNNKKYLLLLISNSAKQRINFIQDKNPLEGEHRENPLNGNILTVKVPFRYRRVMCTFESVPVQSLQKGDKVEVDVVFMGVWKYGHYCGYSWKLSYIKSESESTTS
jgi:hypothetical protein